MPEVITNNLDLWTSALLTKSTAGRGSNGKLEAYGIKKLRELILELAVRGKLVSQDTNDEPASALLERIAKEKVRLIKEGRIAKKESLPRLSEEEKLFDLPNGWEWARFGEIFELEYGNNLPEAKRTSTGEYPVFGSNGVVGSHDSYCIDKPCIVVGRKGSAGALNLCLNDKCWVTDVAYSVIPPTDMELEFVFKLFHTLGLDSLGKGIKPGLNRNEAYLLPVAIPSLNEQHRIVAKVDELMALCDQLEQQQTHSIEAHQTLVEILLGTLTNSPVRPEPVEGRASTSSARTEFGENWTRIANHFDTLFTTDHSIDQLKQTILQLAVMGKLVPQDPNDEPASVLLEKITAEKARLIKEGKIKKEDPLPGIGDAEIPYIVPSGWQFARLGNITNKIGSGSTPRGGKSAYVDSGIAFLRSQNVWNHGLEMEDVAYITEETHEKMSNTVVEPNDILLNITGASLGRCAIYPEDLGEANVSQHVTIIRPTVTATRRYLHCCILSPYTQSLVWGRQVGMAREGLSKKVLEQFEIPFPPLNEQHRIVAKVDELMTLCDALKARLADAQATQVHLADAIVEQAVA